MSTFAGFWLRLVVWCGIALHGLLWPKRQALYRFEIWLPRWAERRRRLAGRLPPVPAGTTRDLMFCFVDHFEPGTRGASPAQAAARLAAWTEGWPRLAARYADADGRHPQHGFFFPPHYHSEPDLRALAAMDWLGVGETDLHLHHERDTRESLARILEETLALYARQGVFRCQGDPVTTRYGFIHGNWALANSRPEYCGVNDELALLAETGCYADFTFPSLYVAQPRLVNAIFRAVSDPGAPKCYDRGRPCAAGRPPSPEEFLLVTGPLGLRRRGGFPFFTVEDADVTGEGPATPSRVRHWVSEGIHVDGRPEWLFVKVHTHGAPERHHDALLGDGAARLFDLLCEEFDDGVDWRLHFVNARELANVVRAAEDGESGDAGAFRDRGIPPYLTRSILAGRPYAARRFLPAAGPGELPLAEIAFPEPAAAGTLEFRDGALRSLSGAVAGLRCAPGTAAGAPGSLELDGTGGVVELILQARTELREAGAETPPVGASGGSGGAKKLTLAAGETRRFTIGGPSA